MARAKTKQELMEQSQTNFEKLWALIESMPANVLETEFDFSADLKKSEAHWQRDKNLRDVLIHLYEWHQLLLSWVAGNVAGQNVSFLPAPYNWKTYAQMNVQFWEKHQNTELDQAIALVKASHTQVLDRVSGFSDEQLFTKQYFNWTGTTTLGSYCISAMPSHYDWAIKKLRAHTKRVVAT